MRKASPVSRAGRPKDPAKRAAIVEAAISLFAAQRYEMVTMEDVAAQAGVSKMTVYSHFADKEALFEDVVRGVSDQMMSGMSDIGSGKLPLRERLADIGAAFVTVIINLHAGGMVQSLPMLSVSRPLRNRLYVAGPGRTLAMLAGILKEAAERHELILDSPEEAAQDLVSLWEAGLTARIVFGVVESATTQEIAQRAQRGTDVFLRAYGNPRKLKPL
jgi:TetR/AcrR family transcriptional regulator, mexJK operon transcriptional repressor